MNLSSRWEVHASGEGPDGITATKEVITDKQFWATAVAGHTDRNSLVQILDGTTVIWEIYVDVSRGSYFNEIICIPGTRNTAMNAKITASTNLCFISLSGYSA